MKIVKYSITVYRVLAAIIFIVIFLAAAPDSDSAGDKAVEGPSTASVDKMNEDLKALREETGQLRRLMWGATGRNKREIQSLKNALSIQETVKLVSGSEGSGPAVRPNFSPVSDKLDSFEDEQMPLANSMRDGGIENDEWENVKENLLSPELEAFEAILTDEERARWMKRVSEQVLSTHEQAMAGIPVELRETVGAQARGGMEKMRELMKYSVLGQKLSEAKLRETLGQQ